MTEQLHNRRSSLHQLRRLFEAGDTNADGTITLAELSTHLKDKRVRAQFDVMGMEIHEARGLFKLLDVSDQGFVTIEDFMFGCMRLKGGAKAVDLATLLGESKRMLQEMRRIEDKLEVLIAGRPDTSSQKFKV